MSESGPTSTKMPEAGGVACRQCSSANNLHDLYCGICGATLAELLWQAEGGDWQSGDGRLTLRQESEVVRLHFENHGVVAAALILEEEQAQLLPGWLDSRAVRGKVVPLLPSAGPQPFELRVDSLRLKEILQSQAGRHRGAEVGLTAELTFLTNLTERSLRLTLVLARKPWVVPTASYYRYLPAELLAGEGLQHPLELHLEASTRVQLLDITVQDDSQPAPEGYEKIPGERFIQLGVRKRESLPCGVVWPHSDLRLKASQLLLPEGRLGWFSASVRYQLLCDNESHSLESHLSGVIGPGPCLRIVGPSSRSIIPSPAHSEDSFAVENPGGVPVRVVAVETRWDQEGREELAPKPDCLEVSGLLPGELLGPGEKRTLRLRFRAGARPLDEIDSEISTRRVLVLHDGWQVSETRHAALELELRFGVAEIGQIGIDFGTTNSVVCLMGQATGYPLAIDNGLRPEQLPSLMYFQDAEPSAERAQADFLFGSEAQNTANKQPTNLVKSIKTVVVRGSTCNYRFLRRFGSELQRVFKPAQELLDTFIDELRRRAENGTARLPFDVRRRENWGTRSFVFREAFFSHPVQVTENMKRVLFAAATAAGLNQDHADVEEFFAECCVDEATAAVLSYVDHRARGELKAKGGLPNLERVLCFDMGGGTTDVAAAEVRGLASFVSGEEGALVEVDLGALDGDNSLGGNLLDQLIAEEILSQVRKVSAERGTPVLIDELREAVADPSFTSFELQLGKRREIFGPPSAEGDHLADAESLYRLAQQVLVAAEALKVALGQEEQATKGLSGSGWPRERASGATESEEFRVVLERSTFERLVRPEIEKRLPLLDNVVRGAGWQWPDVTTLLFTGQSMRSPFLRSIVREYVTSSMGAKATKKHLLVQPDPSSPPDALNGFDPKLCVAQGAAVWGISRAEGAWIKIKRSVHERLAFDFQRKVSRKFPKIKGLERGTVLPSENVILDLGAPTTKLSLYRDGREHVVFRQFPRTQTVHICVHGLADIRLTANGKVHKGKVLA